MIKEEILKQAKPILFNTKMVQAIQREVEEAIKNGKQYGLNADELLSEAEAMAKSTRHSTVECINFITEKEKRRRMTNYER